MDESNDLESAFASLNKHHSIKLRPELLVLPPIPKPMHGMNPRTVLGVNWWNRERKAAYKRAEYHCSACGVSKYKAKFHKHLEGHEVYDIDYMAGRMTYVECVALCHCCHNFIHAGRLRAMVQSRMITAGRFKSIITYGNKVLRKYGITRPVPDDNLDMADWGDWRLVIGEEEYPPKFKSFEEWNSFYNG